MVPGVAGMGMEQSVSAGPGPGGSVTRSDGWYGGGT